jgi:hypothetical protein
MTSSCLQAENGWLLVERSSEVAGYGWTSKQRSARAENDLLCLDIVGLGSFDYELKWLTGRCMELRNG